MRSRRGCVGIGRQEQACVLALVSAAPGDWSKVAGLLARTGGVGPVMSGQVDRIPLDDRALAAELTRRLEAGAVERAEAMIADLADRRVRLVTVLDDDYPPNLHQVFNRPPFLWVRGELASDDRRAVSVVGTRQASEWGRAAAARFARELTEAGHPIVSGLALGIDTAAHEAALAAGRTVAVIGTGILARTYPPANRSLAERIAAAGAVVSQFWPSAPPRRSTFPMRNVVMSGMSLGTVVVEASQTSGARMQARFAVEQGRRLFLLDRLVEEQDWAKRYAEKPGVQVVRDPADVLPALSRLADPTYQMSLTF
jgi:DNA processing protein